MVENLENLDDLEDEGGNRTMALAAIVGSALLAGTVVYLLRRRQPPPPPPEPAATIGSAWERAREAALGEERLQATREFLMEKVLPELKPALLGVLEELQSMVDDGFKRAERAIKAL